MIKEKGGLKEVSFFPKLFETAARLFYGRPIRGEYGENGAGAPHGLQTCWPALKSRGPVRFRLLPSKFLNTARRR